MVQRLAGLNTFQRMRLFLSLHKPDASKVRIAHVADCMSCQAWEIAGCPALLKTSFEAASKPSASLQLHTVIVEHYGMCQFDEMGKGMAFKKSKAF